jgi:hypothetical protein
MHLNKYSDNGPGRPIVQLDVISQEPYYGNNGTVSQVTGEYKYGFLNVVDAQFLKEGVSRTDWYIRYMKSAEANTDSAIEYLSAYKGRLGNKFEITFTHDTVVLSTAINDVICTREFTAFDFYYKVKQSKAAAIENIRELKNQMLIELVGL